MSREGGAEEEEKRESQAAFTPRTEPDVTFPTDKPPRPSLWTSHAPAGHVPLAAARFRQVKLSWGTYNSPEPSFCAQTKSETPGKNGNSLQRKRCEDCIVPYTPKRLRQSQALSTETGKNKDVEAQGPSAGRAPAPLCVAPRVSEFIQPYLDSQYKETTIPRKVLFHLRSHRGPVNSIQWCPVFAKSHMLLSVSMDKTFKVWNAVDSGRCLQTYSLHSEAVRAARWSPCGRRILSGGFDFALHLTDLETGTQLFSGQSDFRITTLKFHPKDHSLFVCGGFHPEVKAWDIRTGKQVSSSGNANRNAFPFYLELLLTLQCPRRQVQASCASAGGSAPPSLSPSAWVPAQGLPHALPAAASSQHWPGHGGGGGGLHTFPDWYDLFARSWSHS